MELVHVVADADISVTSASVCFLGLPSDGVDADRSRYQNLPHFDRIEEERRRSIRGAAAAAAVAEVLETFLARGTEKVTCNFSFLCP